MEHLNSLLEICLTHFHLMFQDWGLAIVVFAIGVRFVLLPIQTFNFIQQRKLRSIQPEIDRITQKYETDPLRAFQETGELKKQNGVRTWSSLFLSVAQIPIFFGMYHVISSAKNLSGAAFLWIPSLATPDALFILPLLVAAMTYLQFRNSMPTSGPALAHAGTMGKVLPAINFALMAFMPAALVLYYATSGIFQVASETVLKRIV